MFYNFGPNFKSKSCFEKLFLRKIVLSKNGEIMKLKSIHFGVFLNNEKMFRELTDPDLSLLGPASSCSDPWQLYLDLCLNPSRDKIGFL